MAWDCAGIFEYYANDRVGVVSEILTDEARRNKVKALDQIQLIDKRRLRAMQLTALIMQIVSKYVPDDRERDLHRDLHYELQEALENVGAEIVSDFDRQQYGLSPRGPDGWTMEEIIELEKRRLELMYAPMPPMIFPKVA
jgi:hypothetical protein